MITIAEQRAALQPIFEALQIAAEPAFKKVMFDTPPAIQKRDLVLLVVQASDARYSLKGETLTIRREWQGRLYVMDITDGRPLEAEQAVQPFLTAVPVHLAAYPTVYLSDSDRRAFVLDLDEGGDGGSRGAVPHGDRLYAGTIFRFFTEINDTVESVTY